MDPLATSTQEAWFSVYKFLFWGNIDYLVGNEDGLYCKASVVQTINVFELISTHACTSMLFTDTV